MELLIFGISTIVFLYSIFILLLIAGFYKIPEETYETAPPANDISIIIAFRNEENHIEKLFGSLTALEYPLQKFEIIFVDDNSEDSSYMIVETLLRYTKIKARVLKLPKDRSGKKAAIEFGISKSVHPWILTTDADCTFHPLWLKLFDQKMQSKESVMVAGPVNINLKGNGFIKLFQQFDLAAMMGTTVGGFGICRPFLSNGANLAFKKSIFNEVDGYTGNMEIASGDDIFLMEKFFQVYPNKVNYVKACGAIVTTDYVESIKGLIHQRVRWASKSTNYNSKIITSIGLLVGISNILIIVLIVLAFLGIALSKIVPFIVMKFIVDFWMVVISSNFLKITKKLYLYPLIAIIYPFYIVIIAVLSQTMTFEWKGRSLKKVYA